MSKFILIESTQNDRTTNDIIAWLIYNNRDYIRINDDQLKKISEIQLLPNTNSSISFEISGKEMVKLCEDTSYWYRRGIHKVINVNNVSIFQSAVLENNLKLQSFISNFNKVKVNDFWDNNINKLECIHIANRIGILTPKTLVAINKSQVKDFFGPTHALITKSISDLRNKLWYEDNYVSFSHSTIYLNNFNAIFVNSFQPTLFQEYVEKKLEIRSFFLNGKFWSMAIFSQENEKTKYDFRNYDFERPNRCVPYCLPKQIENKFKNLFKYFKMNCGSLDIILTKNNRYVLLEINPIGQFHWLSRNCNYFLDKEIAEEL